jgi:hypothetical protein
MVEAKIVQATPGCVWPPTARNGRWRPSTRRSPSWGHLPKWGQARNGCKPDIETKVGLHLRIFVTASDVDVLTLGLVGMAAYDRRKLELDLWPRIFVLAATVLGVALTLAIIYSNSV